MNARPRGIVCRGSYGSIMIEVLVAMVLLAILILPLAGGMLSAAGRVNTVKRFDPAAAEALTEEGVREAWSWGPRVAAAWWLPGPMLHIRPDRSGDPPPTVGLWVDGWPLTAERPDPDGVTRLGSAIWSTYAGRELVVRVRISDGIWGPPWRSLVPGVTGAVLLPASAEPVAGVDGLVVAHTPGAGNPAFEGSWTNSLPEPGPLGIPFLFPTGFTGPGGLRLDSAQQSWSVEPLRELDLYF